MAVLGHKPSFYLRFFERLLCDVNQPLGQLPGDRLRTAKCGHSIEKKNPAEAGSFYNSFQQMSGYRPLLAKESPARPNYP